jgi:hypothetical protein
VLPNSPVFNGLSVHWQTASLASCHNAFGIVTSNTVTGVIGDLGFL